MSMTTYAYDTTYTPPMPTVPVQIQSPGHTMLPQNFVGLIDSGADGTLIPLELLEAAAARHVGEARLIGVTGSRMLVDIYLINLRIGGQWVRGIRAAAVSNADEIILGRDVLAHLIVTLNGLAGVTEVST